MISICVTIKNRSLVAIPDAEKPLRLFPNCVDSVVNAIGCEIPCELVVADFGSTDWPLAQWLAEAAHPIAVNIISVDGDFSRGKGLNVAAAAARGDILFFLDADALVCQELFREGRDYVMQGKAYFPILFSFDDPAHEHGHWLDVGYGLCMLSKELFLRSGGWPEYRKWGKEDDDFFARIQMLAETVRHPVPGFYHQWHPDDLLWKNKYSAEYPYMLEEQAMSEKLRNELMAAVPAGETVILVDEGRFDSDWLPDRRVAHFLERDGVYWGNPDDDKAAIEELDRFRQQGVRYIALTWLGFWWFDYYSGLHNQLLQRCRCVLTNELVVMFDLQAAPEAISQSPNIVATAN